MNNSSTDSTDGKCNYTPVNHCDFCPLIRGNQIFSSSSLNRLNYEYRFKNLIKAFRVRDLKFEYFYYSSIISISDSDDK